VPVEINGTPKQFLLDIGTNPDEVSEPVMAELHLPQVDQSTASNAMADLNTPFQFGASFYDVKGANGAMSYRTRVRLASFAFAGATVQNLQMPVANDRDMGKSEPYDGRLTGSLFPQYDMNFDFGGKKFSFADPTSCADPNQVAYWPHAAVAVIPMTISNGKMSVPVTINGHTINALIDTGSARTVMRRDVAENMLGLKPDGPDMAPDGDTEDGMGQQVYRHTFAQIAFEGVIANNVPVRIQANGMVRRLNRTPVLGSRAQFTADPGERIADLALGMDVLRQLHLYAAFGQNKLYVTSAQAMAGAEAPKL
jgi:predicted aspartyl protease